MEPKKAYVKLIFFLSNALQIATYRTNILQSYLTCQFLKANCTSSNVPLDRFPYAKMPLSKMEDSFFKNGLKIIIISHFLNIISASLRIEMQGRSQTVVGWVVGWLGLENFLSILYSKFSNNFALRAIL